MTLTQEEINDIVDKGNMIVIFDIDDTTIDHETLEPLILEDGTTMVEHINRLYNNGDYIIFETARPEELRHQTINTLIKINVMYNELVMGKPKGHMRIDDATVNTEDYLKTPNFYLRKFKKIGNKINALVRSRGF